MKRVVLVVLLALSAGRVGRTDTAPPSLGDFFKPGIVFQDRNGDGAVDFVDARIALADHPTAGELAAAADVAARLGFETSAMNLPVVRALPAARALPVARAFQASEPDTTIESRSAESLALPTVFIGAGSLPRGVSLDSLGASGLKAGDGVVSAFTVDDKPAVAVLGGDDDGLAAAAVMLAGRLPHVWDQKSPTTEKIAEEVKELLNTKGIAPASAVASSIVVRPNTDAVERIVIDLQMANGGDVIKSQVALNQFKAIGSRDPKRALSYPAVRSVRMRVRGVGAGPVSVDLPRVTTTETAASQPPGRRPGGGTKENFDLSTFYSIDGALADSDNNLIPDRVDVLLSPDGDGAEEEPGRGVGEPGERGFEPGHTEHPEQEAAENAGNAVIEHLGHPGGNHEQSDRQRVVRGGSDAEREQPEGKCATAESTQHGRHAQLRRSRRRRSNGDRGARRRFNL